MLISVMELRIVVFLRKAAFNELERCNMANLNDENILTDEQCRRIEEFMKQKRIAAGYLKQSDAARAIGVSQDLISRLESHFSPNIRVGQFGMVLKAYGISPNKAYEKIDLYPPSDPSTDVCNFIEEYLVPVLMDFDLFKLKTVKRIVDGLK